MRQADICWGLDGQPVETWRGRDATAIELTLRQRTCAAVAGSALIQPICYHSFPPFAGEKPGPLVGMSLACRRPLLDEPHLHEQRHHARIGLDPQATWRTGDRAQGRDLLLRQRDDHSVVGVARITAVRTIVRWRAAGIVFYASAPLAGRCASTAAATSSMWPLSNR